MKFNLIKNLSSLIVWRFAPEIIVVCGSGKTFAKEALSAVLKSRFKTRAASDEFDADFGAALAALGKWKKIRRPVWIFLARIIISSVFKIVFLPKNFYPEILISKCSGKKDGCGFIKYAKKIIVVSVGDKKRLCAEKFSARDLLVLNSDEPDLSEILKKTAAEKISFGFNEGADLRIINFENRFDFGGERTGGIGFKIEYGGGIMPMFLKGVIGRHCALSAAAALAVGLKHDINLIDASEFLFANFIPPKGKMNLIRGIKNSYIIDGSFSGSPVLAKDGLEAFGSAEGLRKIAILGDMIENGEDFLKIHKELGELAAKTADILFVVGPRGKFIAEAAVESGMAKNKALAFDIWEDASEQLKKLIRENDLILTAASRAVGMENIVKEIAPIV